MARAVRPYTAPWPGTCSVHVMTQAITAFFRTRTEGEAAQNALLENGFARHEVSFVASGQDPTELPRIGPVESVGAESEAAADAFIGSLVGFAAGTAAA